MTRLFSVVALAALAACSGSYDERVREEIHQATPASATAVVHVTNIAGSVRVEGWNKPSVDVQATKYGYDAQELRSITIGVRKEGDAIFVTTTYGSGMHRGGVRYRIFVPAGASLKISNVTVETQAGEIVADLGTVSENRSIDLQATTGAIQLSIAPDSNARIEAHSTVGAFSSDIPDVVQSRENIVGARAGGEIGS